MARSTSTEFAMSKVLKDLGIDVTLSSAGTQKMGFYDTTPVDQPDAVSITSATVSTTNMTDGSANNTLVNVGDTSAADQSSAIEKNFDKIADEVNALVTDVTAIRDRLKELGLVAS